MCAGLRSPPQVCGSGGLDVSRPRCGQLAAHWQWAVPKPCWTGGYGLHLYTGPPERIVARDAPGLTRFSNGVSSAPDLAPAPAAAAGAAAAPPAMLAPYLPLFKLATGGTDIVDRRYQRGHEEKGKLEGRHSPCVRQACR